MVVSWTVTFLKVSKAVEVTTNGGSLEVSSVLERDCILETALECNLCENGIS